MKKEMKDMIEKHSHGDLIYFWRDAEALARKYNFTLHWYYTHGSTRGLSVNREDERIDVFNTIYDLLSFLEGYHLCMKEEKAGSGE